MHYFFSRLIYVVDLVFDDVDFHYVFHFFFFFLISLRTHSQIVPVIVTRYRCVVYIFKFIARIFSILYVQTRVTYIIPIVWLTITKDGYNDAAVHCTSFANNM